MRCISQSLNIPELALVEELTRTRKMQRSKTHDPKVRPIQDELQVRKVEIDILKLLIEESSFIPLAKKDLEPSDFQDKRVRAIISQIFDLIEKDQKIHWGKLLHGFEDVPTQELIAQLATKQDEPKGNKEKMHADYVNRMKEDRTKQRLKILQQKIVEAETKGDIESLELLKREFSLLVKK